MNINIRGSKIEITEAIKSYIEEKIGRLEKYFGDDVLNANVLVKVNGINQIVEVTIPAKKMILRAEVASKNLYEAIDTVSDKLERQIRKNKTRMKKRKNKDIVEEFNFDIVLELEDDNSKVVKRKIVDMKPMDEEEAILQMELIDHDFFVFKDSKTNEINVLYKRKDGNYGIIETK